MKVNDKSVKITKMSAQEIYYERGIKTTRNLQNQSTNKYGVRMIGNKLKWKGKEKKRTRIKR